MKIVDETENETKLWVPRLANGTVIDHIPAGKAFLLAKLFGVEKHSSIVTVGLNLPSTRMRIKDVMKIEGWSPSPTAMAQIAILAPKATINVIEEYRIVRKMEAEPPHRIDNLIICPNSNCITTREITSRGFFVKSERKETHLKCVYCERCFSQNEINHYVL